MLALDGSSLAEQLVMEEAKRLRLVDRQAPGGCILPSGLIKVEEVFGKAKASQVPNRPPRRRLHPAARARALDAFATSRYADVLARRGNLPWLTPPARCSKKPSQDRCSS
jgi:hypothetical protein